MKRIVIAIAGVLSLIAGTVVLSVWWLRSDGGRDWLAREIARRASVPGETDVSVGAVAGDPFGAFRITGIRVRDRAGDWLTIGSADVEWRPLDLLHGTVTILRVDIRAAALTRLPETDPSAPAASFAEQVAVFRDLPSIRIAALKVEDLVLGPPVLGEAATLRIAGGIESAATATVRGSIAINRVDGSAGNLDAKGTYSFPDDTLALDVSASEPAGGLVARGLDIPGLPPFRATAKGMGPLADWKGRAELSFEHVASGETDIAIRHQKNETGFEVTGTAKVPADDSTLLRGLVSGDHRFRATGAYARDAVLTVSEAQWTMSAAEITASGRLSLGDLALDAKAALRKTDESPLRLAPADASLTSLAVEATASGKLPVPALRMSFDAGRVDLPGVAMADVAGAVSIEPDGTERGRVEGSATLRSIAWVNLPALTALAGDEMKIGLAADLDLQRSTILIDTARAAAPHAELTGIGHFGWKDGDGDVKVALAVHDLSVLRNVIALPLTGRFAASLDASLNDFGTSASGTLGGSAVEFSTGDAVADAMLGREVTFGAELTRTGDKVEAKQVTLTSNRTRLQADGAYDIGRDAVAGTYALGVDAGPALGLADGVGLDCACRLSGKVSGNPADLRAAGDLSAQTLRVQDVLLRDLTVGYDLTKLTDEPVGAITVRTETPLGALTARTKAVLRAGQLHLAEIHAESGEAVLRGALDIPLSGAPVAGDLQFDAKALNAILAAGRLEGDGTATGQVKLRAVGGRQGVDATATVAALQFRTAPDAPVISVEKATVGLAAEDVVAGDRNKLDLLLEKGGVGDASFERVAATAQGSFSKARLSLTGKGAWRGPLAVDATADFATEKGQHSLSVSALQGTALGETLSLGKPMRLAWGDAGLAAEPVDLTFGDATMTGHARAGEKAADVSLVLAGLPLKLVDPFWPLGMEGKIDASMAFKGPWAAPEGTFSVSIPQLRVDRVAEAPALVVSVDGDWRRGRLELDGRLAAGDAAPSVFNASLPLRLEGPKLYVDVPREQPVSGRLSWSGETAALWRFAPLPEHLFRGAGKIDVTLSGTVATPDLRGTMTLTDGFYESLEYGTVLRPLDLEIAFDGRRARIARLSAGDGDAGKLDGKGEIAFDAEAGFPFDLALTLKELTAVRRDDVQASASGDLSVGGSMKEAKIASKLTTDLVEIRVLDRMPPEVVILDVTEVGRYGQEPTREKPEKPITADIDLAIDVEMPRRVFVRGRGIDSEWKGNLKVTGPASDPRVGGYLALVRGQLTVVGKTFQMDSGNVVLPDRPNSEPELSLTASHTGRSLTVKAQVEGPVSKPKITLSSSPSLPQDEIVSRVLFDKSTSKLSPYEAAQLGFAIAELSGKGGAGGVMDFARKTLGVDVLQVQSVETAKGSETVVGAGKYLTEDVYLGVKQGATPESSSVGVEVELTPNIIVESDVRRDGQSDVGVKFKLDY